MKQCIWNPLHVGRFEGHLSVVSLLLEKCPHLVSDAIAMACACIQYIYMHVSRPQAQHQALARIDEIFNPLFIVPVRKAIPTLLLFSLKRHLGQCE